MIAALLLAASAAAPVPNDAGKDGPVPFAVRTGFFEKNTSGLAGAASYLYLPDREAFDTAFALTPPLLNGRRQADLPATAFAADGVAAVVKRGNATYDYTVESVSRKGGTLTVTYKTTERKAPGATFASPLIVSFPKAGVEKVVFVENGKEVGSAPTPPAAK